MRVLQWHHERDGSRNYGVYIPRSLFEQLVQLRARSGPAQLNVGGVLAVALEDAATEISALLDQLGDGGAVAAELRDRRRTAPEQELPEALRVNLRRFRLLDRGRKAE